MNVELLRAIFARGLTSGIGSADGQTCIEGAIALACGEPLSDTPRCVAAPDRAYAIRLNDAPWSSPQVRAEALLPLALAQAGTAGTNRTAWTQAVVLGTIQHVLPVALRAAGLEVHAVACSQAETLEQARAAAYAARNAAADARAAARAAYAYAAAANEAGIAAAANEAGIAAANAAAAAAAATTASADDAGIAVYIAAAARAATRAAAAATTASADDALRLTVQVALDAYAAEGRS